MKEYLIDCNGKSNENLVIYKMIYNNMESKASGYYGESKEDLIIYKAIYNSNPHYNGTFIELGAFNGIDLSNTKFFEDNFNWNGVLIEPVKELYDQLIINRPNCDCYNYVISKTEGEVDFLSNGACSGMTNTMTPKFKETWYGDINETYIHKIKSIPINKLIDKNKYPKIDLFSIDVEGGEFEVLDTFDWDIDVHLILIEISDFDDRGELFFDEKNIRNGYYNRDKDLKCNKLLIEKGFVLITRIMGNELWENKKF